MDMQISETCLASMHRLGMILDYTDDGFVLHKQGGWVPASDVIEFYLGMEEYELEQAKETIRESLERRANKAQEKTEAD